MAHKPKDASAQGTTPSRAVFWAAAILLVAHMALGTLTIFSLSQTYDEAVHLASGYAFWRSGEYRVDAARNNPVARLFASLPLLRSNPDAFLQDSAYGQRSDFAYANRFLYSNRVPAETILNTARLFLFLLISPILGWITFRWAQEIAGSYAGLGALFLYAFNPTILSLATLVTGDFTAAALVFLCLYSFAKALRPDSRRLLMMLVAGLCLGLALGSKHSAAILLAVLPLSYSFHSYFLGRPILSKSAARESLLIIFGALSILALVYTPRQLPLWWHGLYETLSVAKGGAGTSPICWERFPGKDGGIISRSPC